MTTTLERRHFDVTELRVERAAADAPPMITGYASVFNRDSLDLGGFIEQIAPGAFKRSIAAAKSNPVEDMIHVFWNHDSGQPLASTRSGKLVLKEDDQGLRFSFPASRLTAAQLEAIQDGDMRMSFGFSTRKDEWTRGGPGAPDRRRVLDTDLAEISPVSKPAYPDTTVAARSRDAWQKTEVPPVADLQMYQDRLRVIEAEL